MKQIWERIRIVGAVFLAFTIIYYVWSWVSSEGNRAAATPGASNYWGFEWILSNLHWMILLVIIIVAFVVLVLQKKKY